MRFFFSKNKTNFYIICLKTTTVTKILFLCLLEQNTSSKVQCCLWILGKDWESHISVNEKKILGNNIIGSRKPRLNKY